MNGDTPSPILNIILDPIFIFWFDMGVKGAALATVISQACSAVSVLAIMNGDTPSPSIAITIPRFNFI